jgi:hypothetical protein
LAGNGASQRRKRVRIGPVSFFMIAQLAIRLTSHHRSLDCVDRQIKSGTPQRNHGVAVNRGANDET